MLLHGSKKCNFSEITIRIFDLICPYKNVQQTGKLHSTNCVIFKKILTSSALRVDLCFVEKEQLQQFVILYLMKK